MNHPAPACRKASSSASPGSYCLWEVAKSSSPIWLRKPLPESSGLNQEHLHEKCIFQVPNILQKKNSSWTKSLQCSSWLQKCPCIFLSLCLEEGSGRKCRDQLHVKGKLLFASNFLTVLSDCFHWVLRAGRGLWRSSIPTPLPRHGHLEQVAQEHPPGWWVWNVSR